MKYQLIYADPPWNYSDKSKHRGGAERHYPTMRLSELEELEVPATDDSVCLMWATYPQLPSAIALLQKWGFSYKTVAFTWAKTYEGTGNFCIGMGHYTRANPEVCLLGVRGRGLKREDAGVRNLQVHPRAKHSKKPDAIRGEIERLFGDVSRLEMFARNRALGWDVWGNEIPNSTEITSAPN